LDSRVRIRVSVGVLDRSEIDFHFLSPPSTF